MILMREKCTFSRSRDHHGLFFMSKQRMCVWAQYHVRLILLGSLFHWKHQLPVGGMPVYSQMSRSKAHQFSQLSIMLGLQENGKLFQDVETTMVSSP